MTILEFREGPGAKSLIACDTCGEEEERLTCTIKKSKLHFCDLQCRAEYKRLKYSYGQYWETKRIERKDAKLLKEHEVPKRCMTCGRIYEGPPGGFPKNRDPKKPEPGLCGCSKTTAYSEEDLHGQAI